MTAAYGRARFSILLAADEDIPAGGLPIVVAAPFERWIAVAFIAPARPPILRPALRHKTVSVLWFSVDTPAASAAFVVAALSAGPVAILILAVTPPTPAFPVKPIEAAHILGRRA